MNPKPRKVFWIEAALAGVTGVLAVATALWRDWIEWAFRVDPDQHTGYAEWLAVGVLLTMSLVLALLAHRELRIRRLVTSTPVAD